MNSSFTRDDKPSFQPSLSGLFLIASTSTQDCVLGYFRTVPAGRHEKMCIRDRDGIERIVVVSAKPAKETLAAAALLGVSAVSYTHLDVYKRQVWRWY